MAGNWKMNLSRQEAIDLTRGIERVDADYASYMDLAVCPPNVYLDVVGKILDGSPTNIGAQNMHYEASGAYTGEASGQMLVDVGCVYVILGHSERRHIFGETDSFINKKVHAALRYDLVPIVCVGETLEQREAGQTNDVVASQFFGSLAGLTAAQMEKVVIAYEPVWAIGTGKVATPAQAEAVHADLRKLIAKRYNTAVADEVRIQYGGSVKPDNAASLLTQPNIDGALVGGASLKVEDFIGILDNSGAKKSW